MAYLATLILASSCLSPTSFNSTQNGTFIPTAPGGGSSPSPSPQPSPSSSGMTSNLSCNDSDALLCEDFETGAIDGTLWNIKQSGAGKVTVDNLHVYDGKFALHVHTTPLPGSTAEITEIKTFPATSGNLFGRAMVYVSQVFPVAHGDLVLAQVSPNQEYGVIAANQRISSFHYDNGDEKGLVGPPSPLNQWYCLEWNMNGGEGTVQNWVNGTLITASVQTGIDKEAFNTFVIGLEIFQNDTANAPHGYDFWYDNVEVGSARIGCPPPPAVAPH